MKTFKEFLTEAQIIDIDQFLEDCSFYLEQVKGSNGPILMYHGSKTPPREWDVRRFRPREKSRDTAAKYHAMINEWMTDEFGYPFRNGMFCTGNSNEAHFYGAVSLIFPIGKFEWLSNSEIVDLSVMIDEKLDELARLAELSDEEADAVVMGMVTKTGKWYHNKALAEVLKTRSEIMIKCDKYYIIKHYTNTAESIIEAIRNL